MIDLVLAESMSVLVVAPPPVQPPCDVSAGLTCEIIDARLADLAVALGTLAAGKAVPMVDLYDVFTNDVRFSEPTGSANSLYRLDGLHPKLATGDDLIAAHIASALLSDSPVPEPTTAVLLATGLGALSVRRRSRPRAQG